MTVAPTRNILLFLEFDGTPFSGWQIQADTPTVQGELETALRRITDTGDLRATGAGRTDAGVHGLCFPVSFRTERTIPLSGLCKGLNSMLPAAIRVLSAREVAEDFCARRSARGKRYRYRLLPGGFPSALERHRVWWLPEELDEVAMREAAAMLVGRHDFSAFRAAGCTAAHPVREIRAVTLRRVGCELWVEVDGTAFLRHMVRNIVGSLVEVGRGRMTVAKFSHGFVAGRREFMGPMAPAAGLYLVFVLYDLE